MKACGEDIYSEASERKNGRRRERKAKEAKFNAKRDVKGARDGENKVIVFGLIWIWNAADKVLRVDAYDIWISLLPKVLKAVPSFLYRTPHLIHPPVYRILTDLGNISLCTGHFFHH